MTAQAYGPRAKAVAARFPSAAAVFCDIEYLSTAYTDLAHRRMRGELFYSMLLWDDPRARLAWEIAPVLLSQFAALDDRRRVFDELASGTLSVNGSPVAQFPTMDDQTRLLAREFVELGSAQLFWSSRERERFVEVFGRRRSTSETLTAAHELPVFTQERLEGTRVVVWAPELQASATALLAFAFEEWRGEVYVVCAGGEPPSVRAKYLLAGDSHVADVLAGAALVVDASLADPGAALGFAEREIPLLTPATSGAHEFIRDAVVYDPASWRTAYSGALRALGRPARLLSATCAPLPQLRVSKTDWSKGAPLASVVVVTYNRPHELEGALKSVAAQTYPNVQTVVINDGGVSIADVCSRFPDLNIKMLDRTENVKHIRAYNIGLQAADGTYICGLADDDRIFPDHVERLVDALERSGGSLAHSNCITHYFKIEEDGSAREIGFNASAYTDELDPTAALAATSINPTSFMMRRDLYERMGWWDPDAVYADYEIQLRMSLLTNFIHVDHFTTTYVLRDDATNIAAATSQGDVGVAALRYVFERYPVKDRPIVERQREMVIEMVRKRPAEQKFFIPPTVVL